MIVALITILFVLIFILIGFILFAWFVNNDKYFNCSKRPCYEKWSGVFPCLFCEKYKNCKESEEEEK